MKDYIFPMNLQLFAEGGAAAGGDGGAEGTGVSAPAAGVQSKGVTAPVAEVQTGQQQTVDRTAEFEAMIKGDYKDVYQKSVQSILQPRLRSANETKQKYEALLPLVDTVAAIYGKSSDDVDGLIKALENDDAFFEKAAAEQNMEPRQYRQIMQLQRENNRLKAQNEQQAKQERDAMRYAAWTQQAEQAKQMYPNLDLRTELGNQHFCQLLDCGIDVGNAYLIVHRDDLFTQFGNRVAQNAENKVAKKVAAGAARPAENGTNSQGAVTVKADPSKMTREERRAYAQRAARGERISF